MEQEGLFFCASIIGTHGMTIPNIHLDPQEALNEAAEIVQSMRTNKVVIEFKVYQIGYEKQ